MAREDHFQNPNLAQIALVSSAEINSSGRPAIPSREPSVPVLAGCAVLTLARIMRAGSRMRDDLEGTV